MYMKMSIEFTSIIGILIISWILLLILDLAVSGLMPGESTTVTGSVKYSRKLLKGYTAAISIKSPDGKDHVTLAQKGVQPDEQGIHRVYRYRGRRKK